MRISDWSSDVCSSDLIDRTSQQFDQLRAPVEAELAINARGMIGDRADGDPVFERDALESFAERQRACNFLFARREHIERMRAPRVDEIEAALRLHAKMQAANLERCRFGTAFGGQR